jgi:hypothetical protein
MDRKWFRNRRWLLAYAAMGLFMAGCGDDATETCVYAGKSHEIGDLFPSSDGCNMCGCEAGGAVTCTEKGCSAEEGCDDDGVRRDEGERWTADGGCRSCVCTTNGTITCSVAQDCGGGCDYGGQRYAEGASFPSGDGCNTCNCLASGEVSCTERACAGSCEYDNQLIPVGMTFKATDGCNECTCVADRMLKCTTRSCTSCKYNGRTYAEGEQFTTADGCTICVCGQNGGSDCSDAECPEGCNYGGSWYLPRAEVICPHGCGNCVCSDDLQWNAGTSFPDCRRHYAELCIAGPGANRVDASFLYREVDSLAIETDSEGCESSYLLCFNPQEISTEPLPVDVWLVQVEGAGCDDADLRTQFVYDLAPIREYIQPRYPVRAPVVTLQMNGEQLDYPF